MHKGLIALVIAWILGNSTLSAQTLPPMDRPKASLESTNCFSSLPDCSFFDLTRDNSTDSPCIWVNGEYLLWWVKNTPLPPLMTTGSSSDPVPGALGQPSTLVLFGGSGDYGATSGGRLTVGGWLDSEHTYGFESSGFLLERRSVGFSALSNPSGNPPLYIPVFRGDLGHEGTYSISDPVVGFNGAGAAYTQIRLWGVEANGLYNAYRNNGLSINLVGGFRYIDLSERLTIQSNSTDFVNQVTDLSTDSFATRNQFYGGQVGFRAHYQTGRLSLELDGKVALGDNHETVNINGSTLETGIGSTSPGTFPGGVFTQPSNIGVSSKNQFAVLPEGQIKVGYQILPNFVVTVGYDILYWNQVLRAGSQVDRNINPTQSLGGQLAGSPTPDAQFNRTDFWAQGINFGLQFRY